MLSPLSSAAWATKRRHLKQVRRGANANPFACIDALCKVRACVRVHAHALKTVYTSGAGGGVAVAIVVRVACGGVVPGA